MLITTEQLSKHLADPLWVVLDTRYDITDASRGQREYEAAHIPGAYFLSLEDDLSGPKTGKNGRHPLPDIASFVATLNRLGIGPESQVIVYDEKFGSIAARLWWMLRWLGHERVALLDGGFARWVKEGRPTTREPTPTRLGSFIARPNAASKVDADFVGQHLDDMTFRLMDARAPERFQGLQEPIDPVAGHIPGAINRFWRDNVLPDGRFKPASQLRAEFEKTFDQLKAADVVHMCGSGVTACHNLFAMELAGLTNSRLYPGSWSEWCADDSRPIAR